VTDIPSQLDLFEGVPFVLQVLFWIALSITLTSFVSVFTLVAAAAQSRRRGKREHPEMELHESDFLWVFLVPALNEEVTIADSVARLQATAASDAVIFVINDGSDDATGSILAAIDEPRLRVLTRVVPHARVGKAAALNEAFRHVRDDLLTEDRFARWTPDRVIIGVVDADGRLAPQAPNAVAWHFSNPHMGGVQTLVRIYNRQGFLRFSQDVEFGSFGFVYQAGRSAWGTANMGGNGQFNRLSALDQIADETGPWRDRLTEDQDLGVRLLQAGWSGAQENRVTIEQQGLASLRRLYRQRIRWAQGSWQALPLLGGTWRARTSLIGRIDAVYYLLTPVLQLIVGMVFAATLVLAAVFDVPFVPGSVIVLVLFVSLGFGPGFLSLLLRGDGWRGVLLAVLFTIPYAAYSWLVFPVLAVSLIRQLMGRTGWTKTARETLDTRDDAGLG
jgi:1,2-diacylglycerol 3-beta-glucosyltransferase